MRRSIVPLVFGSAMALLPVAAHAAPVWVGDLETGDLSQFNFVLNGDVGGNTYASAVQDIVQQGDFAARLELHNDAIWPSNQLRRVEVQHRPDDARTAEGATTFFAWSFYLPDALPQDPGHTLGYWESANSYAQMMAFNANGQDVQFITQQPYTVHWSGKGVITPGQWHRFAMRVLWSKDPLVGEIDVWLDGEQVVTAAQARTLADDNPHFTQVGLLRGNVDIDTVPVIYIDNALEGDSLLDVDPPEEPGGTGTGGSDSGGGDTAGTGGGMATAGDDGPLDGGSTADGETPGTTTATLDGGGGPASTGDPGTGDPGFVGGQEEGCACRSGRRDPGVGLGLLAVFALLRRRSRARPR